MSAELAHQKADKHLCVALHRKVRIRLHPSTASMYGIASNWCVYTHFYCGIIQEKTVRLLEMMMIILIFY